MRAHVLQHVPFEGLGSIEAWLRRREAAITTTRLFEAADLPDVADVDLLIALGGPMSVNDEATLPWLVPEKRFVRQAIEAGTAVLGICLGPQLIASTMGERVYPGPEKEIGWWPIRAETRAPSVFTFPDAVTVFHWHGETFDLPRGATHLASSAGCRHQAFQLGDRVLGLQFHLETTPASAAALIDNCRDELISGRFIQTEAQLRSVPDTAYADINTLMEAVLNHLVRGCDLA
jgi:GMP synthase-like glutamine amidotransferase